MNMILSPVIGMKQFSVMQANLVCLLLAKIKLVLKCLDTNNISGEYNTL